MFIRAWSPGRKIASHVACISASKNSMNALTFEVSAEGRDPINREVWWGRHAIPATLAAFFCSIQKCRHRGLTIDGFWNWMTAPRVRASALRNWHAAGSAYPGIAQVAQPAGENPSGYIAGAIWSIFGSAAAPTRCASHHSGATECWTDCHDATGRPTSSR